MVWCRFFFFISLSFKNDEEVLHQLYICLCQWIKGSYYFILRAIKLLYCKLRTTQLQLNKMNISLGIWTITNKGNAVENKEYLTSSYWKSQFTPQRSSTSFTWSSLCLNIQNITTATKETHTSFVHTENKLCTFRWFILL